MLRRLLAHYLVNNEQLIEKLANWGPLRTAARMTVYVYFKGKAKLEHVNWEQIFRELRRRIK